MSSGDTPAAAATRVLMSFNSLSRVSFGAIGRCQKPERKSIALSCCRYLCIGLCQAQQQEGAPLTERICAGCTRYGVIDCGQYDSYVTAGLGPAVHLFGFQQS